MGSGFRALRILATAYHLSTQTRSHAPPQNQLKVGRHVNQVVAGRFGKAILELGGNNALIIDASADLDLAVRAVLFGCVGVFVPFVWIGGRTGLSSTGSKTDVVAAHLHHTNTNAPTGLWARRASAAPPRGGSCSTPTSTTLSSRGSSRQATNSCTNVAFVGVVEGLPVPPPQTHERAPNTPTPTTGVRLRQDRGPPRRDHALRAAAQPGGASPPLPV